MDGNASRQEREALQARVMSPASHKDGPASGGTNPAWAEAAEAVQGGAKPAPGGGAGGEKGEGEGGDENAMNRILWPTEISTLSSSSSSGSFHVLAAMGMGSLPGSGAYSGGRGGGGGGGGGGGDGGKAAGRGRGKGQFDLQERWPDARKANGGRSSSPGSGGRTEPPSQIDWPNAGGSSGATPPPPPAGAPGMHKAQASVPVKGKKTIISL